MKISSSTHGLGDTLLLTAICKNFPNRFTVQIPVQKQRFSILFDGLAKVELCDEKDLIVLADYGAGHYARRKLRGIMGKDAEYADIKPLVLHSNLESNFWAAKYLEDKPKPVIICPFVAAQWSQVRDLPYDLTIELINTAKLRGETPIVIQSNSSQKWDCDVLNDLELSKLISLLRASGRFDGANTGVYHLAVAVGAFVNCYQPQDHHLFNSSEWCYSHPSINHYTWPMS